MRIGGSVLSLDQLASGGLVQGTAQGGAERQMLGAAKGILLDWDGCVAVNNRVMASARKLIAQHAERIAIISNNSTHLPADFAEILEENGLAVPQDRIFLAGVEAVRHVAERGAQRVLMLCSPKMRSYARDMGVPLVRDDPDMVVLMRDARFTYAKLEKVANALRDGAALVVANADRTHPGAGDCLVPETGALLAALLACVPDAEMGMTVIGKPGPILFARACARLAIKPQDAVMIGDNPDTDGEGALAFGIRPILVGGASPLRIGHLVDPAFAN